MLRLRLRYTPKWAGAIENFATAYCTRNEWRVTPENDIDDLLQEARIVFWKMEETVPHIVDAPHFMAYFKRALVNMINRMSTRRTLKRRSSTSFSVMGINEQDLANNLSVDDHEWMEEKDFKILMEDAKNLPLIKCMLDNFGKKKGRPQFKRLGILNLRETHAQRLCRVTGIRKHADPERLLKAFLEGDILPCVNTTSRSSLVQKSTPKSLLHIVNTPMTAIASTSTGTIGQ